ncbi:MAG: WD40 repeat domain-containing protein [Planctomycetia bacterium]|nr:WD40 repeat domain-containing protein [Planctomycetia bacterium]
MINPIEIGPLEMLMNLFTHRRLVVVLALCLAALLRADTPAEILGLIDQLGSDDPDVRKVAEKKLFDRGESALAPLGKAVKDHPDPDVKLRAILLAQNIRRGSFGQLVKLEGHTGHVRSLALSRDGKRLLSGAMDATVRLWDTDTGKQLRKFDIPNGWGWQVAFSPDEKECITSGGKLGTLHRLDLESGKEIRTYTFPANHWTYGVAYSRDGKRVFGGVAGKDTDFSIRRFETDTGKEDAKLLGHSGFVWRLALSPDGKKLASVGCNDNSFRLWDPDSGKELFNGKDAHEGYVVGLAFSPDSKTLLTSARDSFVKLWDTENGRMLTTYKGLNGEAEAVAWASDGKRFLASDSKTVYVFDRESGKIVHRFEDHTEKVYAVAFFPDGRRAVSAGEDMVIRMWGVPR